ncbi:MAG: hypothetical protein R6V85_20185 [Polyangia bacterium]
MMIYSSVEPEMEIRQGDIFTGVPDIEAALDKLPVLEEDDDVVEVAWKDLLAEGKTDAVTALVAVRPVDAIVITQDCDAVRSPYLALCEIYDFRQVEGRAKETKSPKSWMSIITQQARINQKWFYLPPDDVVGFDSKMGVDFRRVLRVPREQLEAMRSEHRRGRLNELASAHFRERLSEFYRRYPYDEWYPLDSEELDVYQKSKPESVEPYPWQK